MRMLYYARLCLNLLRIAMLKIRYQSNCKIGWKQLFGKRNEIILLDGGVINIGSKIHTRSDVHLIAQGGQLQIGNGVFMNYNVSITSLNRVVIEDGVTIANNVVIVDHDHNMESRGDFISAPVIIKKNAWIGANSVILKGVTIGEGSTVAAGSVVTRDVPDFKTVAGVPAKILN